MSAAASQTLTAGASDIVFCATGKSGLGHLRRISNIVAELAALRPELCLALVSNAGPAGLSPAEIGAFASVSVAERVRMAELAAQICTGPVIVDTAVLPGLERHEGALCLILRETVSSRLTDFRLPDGRLWDLVCVPNPESHWMPDIAAIGAKRAEATGWIYRHPALPENVSRPQAKGAPRRVLVATGGGGNAETAAALKSELDSVIRRARALADRPLWVDQAAGPRMPMEAALSQADELLDADSQLNELFADYDLVISTAGYNSTLELAALDIPVLLVPILRTLDDQSARSRHWGPQLGLAHEAGKPDRSAEWIARALAAGARRAPLGIDPRGAARCAALISELLP